MSRYQPKVAIRQPSGAIPAIHGFGGSERARFENAPGGRRLYDMAKEEWPPAPPMRFVWRLVKAGPEEKRKSEAALPDLFESVPRHAALAKDRDRPALCAGRFPGGVIPGRGMGAVRRRVPGRRDKALCPVGDGGGEKMGIGGKDIPAGSGDQAVPPLVSDSAHAHAGRKGESEIRRGTVPHAARVMELMAAP